MSSESGLPRRRPLCRSMGWLLDSKSWLTVSCGPSSPAGIFLLIISTFIALSISRFMTTASARLPFYVVQSLAIILMVFGLTVQLTFFKLLKSITIARQQVQHHQNTSSHVILFGLALFYTGGSLLDLAYFVVECECWTSWQQCSDHDTRRNHFTDPFYHGIRVLFGASTMLFCFSFHGTVFRRCVLVTHGLALVAAAAVCLWFETWFNEMVENLMIADYVEYEYEVCKNNTNRHVDNDTIDCWKRSTSTYNWITSNARFLDPFSIEFMLLVCHCLVHWFVDCRSDDDSSSLIQTTDNTQLQISLESGYDSSPKGFEASTSTEVNERSRLLAQTNPRFVADVSASFDSLNNVDTSPSAGSSTRAWCLILMTGAVIANVIFCLLAFLTAYDPHDDVGYKIYLVRGETVYGIVYCFLLCVVIGASFLSDFRLRRKEDEDLRTGRRWSGLEYLVLLTSAAPFLDSILTIIAHACGQHSNMFDRVINIIKETLNTVEVLLQTAFVFYAKNVGFETGRDRRLDNERQESTTTTTDDDDDAVQLINRRVKKLELAKQRFKAIVLSVTLSNGAFWLVDSFVDVHQANHSFQNSFYDDWIVVFNIETPISIFYRFNCILLLLSVYLDA